MKKQLAILVCISLFLTHFDAYTIKKNEEVSRMQRLKSSLSHEFDEFMKCMKSDQNCDKKREKIYVIAGSLLIALGAYAFAISEIRRENKRVAQEKQQQALRRQQELREQLTTPRGRLIKKVAKKWKRVQRLSNNLFNKLNPDLFMPDRQEEVLAMRKEIKTFLDDRRQSQSYFSQFLYLITGTSKSQLTNDLQQANEIEEFLQQKEQQLERLRSSK